MSTPTSSSDQAVPSIEETTALRPKFDADGLIPCIATDAETGAVVMFAHMNAEAFAKTIETGVAHYWSRSRGALWRKGETSGHEQHVEEMRVDCDQDAVWIRVHTAGTGASCHTGRHSCFYRAVPLGAAPTGETQLSFVDADPLFDPLTVYAGT
jgi:phosphoribosyl-AMP cyclohydrolase